MSKDEITITHAQFTEIMADVAATMCSDYTDWCEERGISDSSSSIAQMLVISAMFSAKLDTALFDKETMEVEE